MSLHALYRMADAIERLAFQMPAPNQWTPQFVALAVAAREQANELRRTAALAGAGEPLTWLCARKDVPGTFELADPNEKATNPEYWTDAFPVYQHPAGAVQVTEEALESAMRAYSLADFDWCEKLGRGDTPNMEPRHRVAMRAALTAALNPGGSRE